MSNLLIGIPKATQELLEAIHSCDEEILWKDGTYLHPKGKVVFQGVVTPGDTRPDGGKWVGEKPMYLIVYNHPKNESGMCDAHWFELDVMDVEVEVLESETLTLPLGTVVTQEYAPSGTTT